MSWRLMVEDVGLLVVDAQEKLVVAITEPADWLARLGLLVQGAHLLGLPIVLTEQVPSKLGKTVSAVAKTLGTGAKPIAKSQFERVHSCGGCGCGRCTTGSGPRYGTRGDEGGWGGDHDSGGGSF